MPKVRAIIAGVGNEPHGVAQGPANALGDFEAIETGKAEVYDGQVGLEFECQADAFRPGIRDPDNMSQGFKQLLERFTAVPVIFNDQDCVTKSNVCRSLFSLQRGVLPW